MTKTRHSAEVKQAAVAAVQAGERVADVAKRMKITAHNVQRWARGEGLGPLGGRRAASEKPAPGRHEAIALLRQAEASLWAQVRAGKIKKPGQEHLLMLLALRTMEGAT